MQFKPLLYTSQNFDGKSFDKMKCAQNFDKQNFDKLIVGVIGKTLRKKVDRENFNELVATHSSNLSNFYTIQYCTLMY